MTDSPNDDPEPISEPDASTVETLRQLLRADDVGAADPTRRERSIQAALLESRALYPPPPVNAPVPIASRRTSRRRTQLLAAAAAVVVVVVGAFALTGRDSMISTSQEDAGGAADSSASEVDRNSMAGGGYDAEAPATTDADGSFDSSESESSGGATDEMSTTTAVLPAAAADATFPGVTTSGLIALGEFADATAALRRAESMTFANPPTDRASPGGAGVPACVVALNSFGVAPVATAEIGGSVVLIARGVAEPLRTLVLAAPDCNVLASN